MYFQYIEVHYCTLANTYLVYFQYFKKSKKTSK